jgi:hypothetical protein
MFDRRAILRLFASAPLAQMAQQSPIQHAAPPPRQRVIPMDFIIKYRLRPSATSYGPFLIGDDGQPYDFDEVMGAVFEMTREHWALPKR